MKPTVYLFYGVPGSGKSYFAKQFADKVNLVRLNGDSMRMAIFGSVEKTNELYNSGDRQVLNSYTFGAIDYALEQLLLRAQSVVYDAHHNKLSIRKELSELASKYDGRVITVWIQTPETIAIERGQTREAAADSRRLSEEEMREVIARHRANMDDPQDDELYVKIDGQIPFDEQYTSFFQQLSRISNE